MAKPTSDRSRLIPEAVLSSVHNPSDFLSEQSGAGAEHLALCSWLDLLALESIQCTHQGVWARTKQLTQTRLEKHPISEQNDEPRVGEYRFPRRVGADMSGFLLFFAPFQSFLPRIHVSGQQPAAYLRMGGLEDHIMLLGHYSLNTWLGTTDPGTKNAKDGQDPWLFL